MRSRPVVVAHRGSRYLWPENTMVAFEGAVRAGATHIETDVRTTADGVVVCIHDATVDRTTSGSGPVSGFTHSELGALDAGEEVRLVAHQRTTEIERDHVHVRRRLAVRRVRALREEHPAPH